MPLEDQFQFTTSIADMNDVKGVAVSAATGKLYVAYRTRSGVGMIYCLNIYDDAVLWNRAMEGGSAGYINILDADRYSQSVFF
jgi:hypothetical protein